MLHQDLSAVPLFPSPHTVRSYHHLQQPVVLPTLQDLKLQGKTMSNGARISLVYFCLLSYGALWCSHRVSSYGWRSDNHGCNPQWDPHSEDFFIIFSVVGNNVQLVVNFEVLTVTISRILRPMCFSCRVSMNRKMLKGQFSCSLK